MLNSVSLFAKASLLAAVGLFVAAESCQAQVRAFVGGGGNHGGGTRWGVSIGQPYGNGGYYGGWGHSYYQPYGYGGYGYGGYGYNPYVYGTYSTPYYSGYSPMYYSEPYYVNPTTTYQSFYPPDASYNSNQTNNTGSIEVILPATAELWFDGTKTQQTGPVRQFVTPALTDGKAVRYEVRAVWTDQAGNKVSQTRDVHVAPNQHSVVNFMEATRQNNNGNGK